MNVNEFVTLIANVGFPVAVSAYLLVKLEKQLNSLENSITRLTTIISTKLGVAIDNSDAQ